jgi:hypothetical protein
MTRPIWSGGQTMRTSKKLVEETVDKKLSTGDIVEFLSRHATESSEAVAFWQDYNNGMVTLLSQKTTHLWRVQAADGMIFYAFDDEFTER